MWSICVTNDQGYVPFIVITTRSFPNSWLVTGLLTRVTQQVSQVELELPTLPEHLSSPPVFSGVRGLCFVNRWLPFFFCPLYLQLYCLFFIDLRLLMTSVLSVLHRSTASDDLCIVCSDLRLLMTSVLSVLHSSKASDDFCIVCSS